MRRVVAISCLVVLFAASLGCSTLGFPTNPVAHTMTKATKQVLAATPRNTAAVPRELAKQVVANHYLEPGDELLIESNDIESELRIPADQQVFADGSVDLGKYGRVKVAGLTLEQAEELIQSSIATTEEKAPSINVRLIQSVLKFYVIGEVNSPGAYPLSGNETVLDGIVAAGGLTLRASACDMLLARPTDPCSCRVALPVCYRAITQLGDTTTNYQLKPGDRIFVGRQTLWEELMQCCFCQKGCERCCKQNCACRDPLVAEPLNPSFAGPATRSIYDPTDFMSDATDVSPPVNTAPVEGWESIPLEEVKRPSADPIAPAEASPSDQPPLDGELDFGELLKQPSY